eukprot:2344853-Rhodomonas_salina.1
MSGRNNPTWWQHSVYVRGGHGLGACERSVWVVWTQRRWGTGQNSISIALPPSTILTSPLTFGANNKSR